MNKKIEFINEKGLTIRGIVHVPKEYETAVVVCHGFPSNHEANTPKRIARNLESRGYLVLRFTFSDSYPSDGNFENKLMSNEVNDIKCAIDFVYNNFSFKRLVLFGHSTGAIDSSLYAYKDKRINKLVLSGVVSDLKHAARYDFSDEQIKSFWERNYIIYNSPGKWIHRKKLRKKFYDEFFKLNIPKAIKKYNRPLLIIHGEKDPIIPSWKDPLELYALANKPKRLVIVKDAGHSYKDIDGTYRNPLPWKRFISELDAFLRKNK